MRRKTLLTAHLSQLLLFQVIGDYWTRAGWSNDGAKFEVQKASLGITRQSRASSIWNWTQPETTVLHKQSKPQLVKYHIGFIILLE